MLRLITQWSLVVAVLLLVLIWLGHLAWSMVTRSQWSVDLFQKHTAVSIALPICALTAYLLVTLLEIRSGPIRMKGWGLEFEGASGPIILWIFVFLAGTFGVWILWK